VQEFIEHRFFDPQEQRFIRAFHTFNQPPSFEGILEEHLRQILQPFLPEAAELCHFKVSENLSVLRQIGKRFRAGAARQKNPIRVNRPVSAPSVTIAG
jgi:hypothetical protein